jgi:hypothetical protein
MARKVERSGSGEGVRDGLDVVALDLVGLHDELAVDLVSINLV